MIRNDFLEGARYISHNMQALQAEQARRMGISRSRLNDLMCNRREWTDYYKERFSEMCGITPHAIILLGYELTKVPEGTCR